MSMPSGASSTPASASSDLISVTASRIRPASGATAPRKPRKPGRQFSSGSHCEYSLWCLTAEPKSHSTGGRSRSSSA